MSATIRLRVYYRPEGWSTVVVAETKETAGPGRIKLSSIADGFDSFARTVAVVAGGRDWSINAMLTARRWSMYERRVGSADVIRYMHSPGIRILRSRHVDRQRNRNTERLSTRCTAYYFGSYRPLQGPARSCSRSAVSLSLSLCLFLCVCVCVVAIKRNDRPSTSIFCTAVPFSRP